MSAKLSSVFHVFISSVFHVFINSFSFSKQSNFGWELLILSKKRLQPNLKGLQCEIWTSVLPIIMLWFTYGKRKICSTIKKCQNFMQVVADWNLSGLEVSQVSTFEWINTKFFSKLIEDTRAITVALELTNNLNSNFINIYIA